MFARFGSDLDSQTAAKLEQGRRTTETLKQDVHVTIPVERQIILLYITMKELNKNVAVKDAARFNEEFFGYLVAAYPQVVEDVRKSGDISMDTGIAIEDAVEEFGRIFKK